MKRMRKLTPEELITTKNILEEEKEQLLREYDVISKSLGNVRSSINTINELIDERTLQSDDYERLLECFPETENKIKKRKQMLAQWYLETGGYFTETDQMVIVIKLYRRDDEITHATHEGIKKLLHVIKPLEDGKKCFQIYENSLSEYGSYSLKIKNRIYEITRLTHGIEKVIFSTDNLMNVLKYIQENHFYEGTIDDHTKRYFNKLKNS